jgi:hypothetical protein
MAAALRSISLHLSRTVLLRAPLSPKVMGRRGCLFGADGRDRKRGRRDVDSKTSYPQPPCYIRMDFTASVTPLAARGRP